ncbi:helix-turn-helix domain-containing protein [Tenacibaculum tangerinum]|uniref:Helix-turn-helix domain-containing protein n=1 Tax=Tenacibaculum tangerinum TaxID=3038772 RepID=A0ABY8L323_9FLAO|nr:helix-turn-helix domain-containing protein [Tenacibaculum tangerinum]WGH75837.1 helix-turn-helix domain-containing protein [Tenacibaculum tangerinum]
MKKILNILFLLFLFPIKATSQTQYIDSIHLNKANYFKNTDLDSLFYYGEKLNESENVCNKVLLFNFKAFGFYKLKDYDKAEEFSLKSLQQIDSLLQEQNLPCLTEAKIATLNRLFWVKKNQEDYNEAYRYIMLMQQTNEQNSKKSINYHTNDISIKVARATVKRALKMESVAKKILLNAYADLEHHSLDEVKNNNSFLEQEVAIINSLGDLYMDLSTQRNSTIFIDSAAYYYDKAYDITKLFDPPHKNSEITYYFKKTEILMARKKFSEALELINNYKNVCNGYNYLHKKHFQKAICFHGLNNSDSTIFYANKFLKDPKKCKTSRLITIYDILSNTYDQLNKLDSAYKYSKLTMDKFNLAEKNKEKTFSLFYNNNFSKAQILNDSILKKEGQKQKKLIFSFVFLLLAFVSISYYLFKKEKKKKKELISIVNKRKPFEAEKKEYNIDEALENKILNEFKNVQQNLDFLKCDFSINSIAEKLNTNTTYVSFVFNRHHDEPFKKYCTKLKINYVVKKLKDDKRFRKYSVQAIGEEIGYTNASAFARAFKKHVGVTPSVFLKDLED